MATWARRRGVSVQRMLYWRKRLAWNSQPAPAQGCGAITMVPIAADVTASLPNGVVITVSNVSASSLTAILAALARLPGERNPVTPPA